MNNAEQFGEPGYLTTPFEKLPERYRHFLLFGTGDTPLRELFACLKAEKIDVPCDIEVEFAVPEGSDAVKETGKCREYCRKAILG